MMSGVHLTTGEAGFIGPSAVDTLWVCASGAVGMLLTGPLENLSRAARRAGD